MKTNCKKWKYLLCFTAVMTVFTSTSFSTQAADLQVRLMDGKDEKQDTTSDKMNSAENNGMLTVTAGVADILDSEALNADIAETSEPKTVTQKASASVGNGSESSISSKGEALTAFAKGMMLLQPEIQPESTLVMAKVNEYVNIRLEADQDSEKVGVLYKDCGGDILEKNSEWTKIKSGDVTGWIKNQYLYFGKEAEELAWDVGVLTAYAETETLRIRKEPSLDAGIVGLLADGQAVEAIAEEGDWVRVSYEGETGFVAAEYVRVEFGIDTAESMEAIRAREEAERAKAAADAAAKKVQQKEAVLATASELEILAALIQCEAGGEPYEGQVAVGAVVMNRVRNGGYPNNITDVIYASGQFVPASGGRMESLILNKTTKASCIQAAQEAINGVCNVGDALHFRRNNGRDGLVIGNHVFW
ncbi:MAG: cell wall hydrolase [Lachnospiraceae bacterium]|nr:cell wall hydrolase [Lachnospiraceae bacterium]MDE7274943.1 cell wall hydrolase [Lachnospiraceae bacterium]